MRDQNTVQLLGMSQKFANSQFTQLTMKVFQEVPVQTRSSRKRLQELASSSSEHTPVDPKPVQDVGAESRTETEEMPISPIYATDEGKMQKAEKIDKPESRKTATSSGPTSFDSQVFEEPNEKLPTQD